MSVGLSGIPVTVHLRGVLDTLQPSLARVGRIILDDPLAASELSISDLAHRAETSEATVLRLARRLGLSGYPQLRLSLAKDEGSRLGQASAPVSSDIDPEDSLEDVIRKVAFADARAVEDTAAILNVDALSEVVDAIVGARRVDVFGVGASASVASDLQQKLHRIGILAFNWSDAHLAMTSAALLGPVDVAIGISHSGGTHDTVDPLALARDNGATTVAITNSPDSALCSTAAHVLLTAARETTFRSGAMGSRIAQLTVIDVVFVGVAQRQFGDSQRAIAATAVALLGRRGRVA